MSTAPQLEPETASVSLTRIVQPLEASKAAIVRDAFAPVFAFFDEAQEEAARLTVTAEWQAAVRIAQLRAVN